MTHHRSLLSERELRNQVLGRRSSVGLVVGVQGLCDGIT
jgi:hypothetical protein